MAICVYEAGNTTIRNGLEPLEDCPGYVLLTYADYQAISSKALLPELSIADATDIALEVFYLLALIWVWKQVEKVT